MTSSPVIGPDGYIYVGSGDGNLYSFTASGALLWTFAAQDRIYGAAAVESGGSVYVGSDDGYFYAIKASGDFYHNS